MSQAQWIEWYRLSIQTRLYICLYYEKLPQQRGSLLGDIDVMDDGYTTNLDMKWLTCPPHEDKNGEFTIEYV